MAETYLGKVENGVIVLDEGTPRLPEGMRVVVERSIRQASLADLSAGLRRLAGRADELPEDLAENHDHYLHGLTRT
jgi:hypothetical protein